MLPLHLLLLTEVIVIYYAQAQFESANSVKCTPAEHPAIMHTATVTVFDYLHLLVMFAVFRWLLHPTL